MDPKRSLEPDQSSPCLPIPLPEDPLSSHILLGPPSDPFPSGPVTKTMYAPLQSPICATYHVHFVLPDSVTLIIFGEAPYKSEH